ncbi:MAG: hypothetical protein HY721_20455, partial [Planctomycetes bacterium]|nr:hypothetical protein [Planctomycetota bacterium]
MRAPVSIRGTYAKAVAVTAFVIALSRQAGAQSWSCSLAPVPTPHGNPVATVAKDAANTQRVYVLGGMDSNSSASDAVESYHPGTNTWAVHAPIPAGRAMARRAGATGANGKIYLFGGQIGNQESAHVDEYDPQ